MQRVSFEIANETSGRRSFTRIELLVVIVVCAIVMALITPTIQAAREDARRAQSKNALRNWGMQFHYRGWIVNDELPKSGSPDETDIRLLLRLVAIVLAAVAALGAAFFIRLVVRSFNDLDEWCMDENGEWKRGRA